ncbi:unnamed protein product [Leuciscus chuanchicus]
MFTGSGSFTHITARARKHEGLEWGSKADVLTTTARPLASQPSEERMYKENETPNECEAGQQGSCCGWPVVKELPDPGVLELQQPEASHVLPPKELIISMRPHDVPKPVWNTAATP